MDRIELAKDLARTKLSENWMVWREIPLGPVSSPRADVFAVAKSFANARFVIYEIKTSRSDFLHDVNSGKYRDYLPYCCQLYFACPAGVLSKADMPEYCGLIIRGNDTWYTIKSATRREFEPSQELLIKLLIKGYEDHFERYRQNEHERFKEYKGLREASYFYGTKMARDIANGQGIIQEAKHLTEAIGKLLGREFPSLEYAASALKAEIENLIQRRQYVSEAVDLADLVLLLFEGRRFFADNIPQRLRTIADRLDKRFKEEEVPR